MSDMGIFEAVVTQAFNNLEIYNAVYGSWNNMHCVQRCLSELQGEGKVTLQLSE
jgi:hypothetical protein